MFRKPVFSLHFSSKLYIGTHQTAMSIDNVITLPSLLEKLQKGGYDDFDQIKDANLFELTEGCMSCLSQAPCIDLLVTDLCI